MNAENTTIENNVIFTKEMIELLYNRVYEHCLNRHGARIDRVEIEEDDISGVEETYQCGYYDIVRYDVSVDELNNPDYDKLREIRLAELKTKAEKERAEREKREKTQRERKEKEEFANYIKLKEKFEKK